MNYHLFQLVNGWAGHNDVVDDVMEWIATWLIFVIFAATVASGGWALSRRRVADASRLIAASLLAFSVAWVVGHVSAEQRPFQGHLVHQLIPHAAGVSMPSDHATAAFTMAAAVGVFVSRRWGAVLAAPALAVGFARIWVGVHYPADIVVALIVALLAVAGGRGGLVSGSAPAGSRLDVAAVISVVRKAEGVAADDVVTVHLAVDV